MKYRIEEVVTNVLEININTLENDLFVASVKLITKKMIEDI